jgi:hypothetical protein
LHPLERNSQKPAPGGWLRHDAPWTDITTVMGAVAWRQPGPGFRLNDRVHPRRLMTASAGVGCNALLDRVVFRLMALMM